MKFRQAGYAKSLSMSQPNRENLVNNIAVTAGLQTRSLGLEPETDGTVYLNPTTTSISLCTGKGPCSFHGDFAEASINITEEDTNIIAPKVNKGSKKVIRQLDFTKGRPQVQYRNPLWMRRLQIRGLPAVYRGD